MQNTYMYKIKKKIHEQAIHISLFLAIDYVYLLYTCWVFFSSETNTTAASAAGRGDKKS